MWWLPFQIFFPHKKVYNVLILQFRTSIFKTECSFFCEKQDWELRTPVSLAWHHPRVVSLIDLCEAGQGWIETEIHCWTLPQWIWDKCMYVLYIFILLVGYICRMFEQNAKVKTQGTLMLFWVREQFQQIPWCGQNAYKWKTCSIWSKEVFEPSDVCTWLIRKIRAWRAWLKLEILKCLLPDCSASDDSTYSRALLYIFVCHNNKSCTHFLSCNLVPMMDVDAWSSWMSRVWRRPCPYLNFLQRLSNLAWKQ